ncbi:MAG: amidohydrolase family protein [Acidobacteriota bacterium]
MVKRLWAALLLSFSLAWAQDVGEMPPTVPPVYALTGATVAVGNGQVLSNASIVIQEGLIKAVGPDIPVPPGAWEMDLSDMYVYPGMIDSLTHVGLRRESAGTGPAARGPNRPPQRGAPRRQGPKSEEGPGLFAYVSAADRLDAKDKKLPSWREAGILSLNVAPAGGIFRGVTAVVNLNGKDADHMIVRSSVAMNMSFQGMGFRTFPGSLLGVMAHIRQTLFDAQQYKAAWEVYSPDKRGLERPETDRTLDALQPVIDGSLPLVFPAKREREIRRALKISRETGTQCVIAGGFEAGSVADLLKEREVLVLLSLNYPKKPKDSNPEAEESLSTLRYRVNAPKAAAGLYQAGVRFAFFSDGISKASGFLEGIRRAIENGLPENAALRAATLSAAEILGVADQLGSIETGKIANLVVSDKDLFKEKAHVRHVFVDGIHYETPAKDTGKKGAKEDTPASLHTSEFHPENSTR